MNKIRYKQRQIEAIERLRKSEWKNSKAKRKGTKTEEQWNKWKIKQLDRLI